MPSLDDEAEFELLDSIFAELDDATLKDLTREKAATAHGKNNNNGTVAEGHRRKAASGVSSKRTREPLAIVRNNSFPTLSSSPASGTAGGKKHCLSKPIQQAHPPILCQAQTATAIPLSSAFKSKTKPAGVADRAALPFARTPLASTRPFQRTAHAAATKQIAVKAPSVREQVKDVDLLTGIDWSDDEDLSLPPASYKSALDVKGKGKATPNNEKAAIVLSGARPEPNCVSIAAIHEGLPQVKIASHLSPNEL